MAAAIDILQKTINGDLLVKGGDFVFGASDEQHIYDIIVSNQGDWKNNVNVGLGIEMYSESSGQQSIIAQNLKIMLQGDGYTVNRPIVTYDFGTGDLNIQPNAVRI